MLFSLLIYASCAKLSLTPPNQVEINIEADNIVFAIIGDYGESGDPARQVSELVKSWSPDFIITTGDNNYDNGELSSIRDNISQYYCDFIYNPDAPESFRCTGTATTTQQNRFFPTLGNHDSQNINNNIPYLNFFTLPGKEVYYDFRWGPLHCFAINSGKNGNASCCSSEQAIWLQEQLVNSTAPFKLVYFHHAPFSTALHGNHTNMQWPFADWGADLVVAGHNHVYERITDYAHPGIHYLVNGVGGRRGLHACQSNPIDSNRFEVTCLDFQFGAIRGIADHTQLKLEFFSISDPERVLDVLHLVL